MNRTAMMLLLMTALAWASAARASQQGTVVMRNWKSMDECAKNANTAYPDYTADSNAKRDAQLKLCLEDRNMPPRAPLSPGR